jgi:hypothetical protein
MQSESFDVPSNVSPQGNPHNSPTPSQHGFRDDDQPAPLPSHHERQRESPDASERDIVTSWPPPPPDHVFDAQHAARLSPTSPSPRNRIEEYENALTRSAKKLVDGPVIEVIKKNRKPDDENCPIANLPNGEMKT